MQVDEQSLILKNGPEVSTLADRMSPTASKGKQQNTTIHYATG